MAEEESKHGVHRAQAHVEPGGDSLRRLRFLSSTRISFDNVSERMDIVVTSLTESSRGKEMSSPVWMTMV